MRRDQPNALARRHFHDTIHSVDELIRTVRVLGNVKAAAILIGQCRNRNAAAGVVPNDEAMSQSSYIMAYRPSCDNFQAGHHAYARTVSVT